MALVAAFLLGASAVRIASGHSGFGDLLHSGHSDRIDGTLTAKRFRFAKPKTSWLSVAPISLRPIDPGCGAVTWEVDPEAEPSYVESADGCWMALQVNVPDDATIVKMLWNLRAPAQLTTIRIELVAFDAFGVTGRVLAQEETTVGPGGQLNCGTVCTLSESLDPTIPGFNPVTNQLRIYTLRYRSEGGPIQTTRLRIAYTVGTAGPK
jgi:hypothetical protein